MRRILFTVLSLFVFMCMAATVSGDILGNGNSTNLELKPNLNFSILPLYFIPNKGQVNRNVHYYAKTSHYTLWLTKEGIVFDSSNRNLEKRHITKLEFHNSNKNVKVVPLEKNNSRVNYFKGSSKSSWITDIQTSGAVLYKNIYKNIDLKVYGIEKQIEYDWVVKPAGNPGKIRFEYKNSLGTYISPEGNLVINTNLGELVHKKPYSYQVIDGRKIEIKSSFKEIKKNVYGFEVGQYDKKRDLIIDPVVLVYSTFLGGSGGDNFKGYYTDENGLIYITGDTTSTDLPDTSDAYQNNLSGTASDVVVMIIDTTKTGLQSLKYCTYIGNEGPDTAEDIKVDQSGNIYVIGRSKSSAPGDEFPVTDGSNPQGNYDVIVFKLNPALLGSAQLVHSTIFGDSGEDSGFGINYTGLNQVVITGSTTSTNFPCQNEYKNYKTGNYDYFVSKLELLGTATNTLYSSYLGPQNNSGYKSKIAISNDSLIYVTGDTDSNSYPTTPGALRTSIGGTSDGFISIIDSARIGSATLVYSSFFGGEDEDRIANIFLGSSNDIYIFGRTDSDTVSENFPVTSTAYQTTLQGVSDGFITKLGWNGASLAVVYSTYIGGSGAESVIGCMLENNRYLYAVGRSGSINFHLLNSYSDCQNGGNDAFLSIIDTYQSGTAAMVFSTCIGGLGNDYAYSVNADQNGAIFLGGKTASSDFPTTSSGYQTSKAGTEDAFGARFNVLDVFSRIDILSPNGGEEWTIGDTHNITWSYNDISPTETVQLLLVQDGSVLGTIADNLPITDLTYSWTAGQYDSTTANAGEDFQIRIETTSGTYIDNSDTNFTLNDPPPALTVTYPTGSEEWVAGKSYYISWSKENLTEDITVELYKNGVFHTLIGTASNTAKKMLWDIPSGFVTGNDYKIRISSSGTESFSPNNFSIIAQDTKSKNPDFNNDYHADILWRNNTTGENRIWYMNGASKLNSEIIRSAGNLWRIGGTGDFNNDGNTDILWRNSSSGENIIWYMNGSSYTGMKYIITVVDLDWKMCGTADFDGDGKIDILWRNVSNGKNLIWYMDDDVRLSYVFIQNENDLDWQIGSTADFNGDGKPDILWRNYSTGENRLWYMDNTTLTGTASVPSVTNSAWQIVGAADFNNDKKMDILWRHGTTGQNIIWFMNNDINIYLSYIEQETVLEWDIVNN